MVSNVAVDLNVPPLNLVYSLQSAPANAAINPRTGLFHWTPNRAQAPGTNQITVAVADSANPALRGSMSFNIRVNHYTEMSVGSLIMLAGTNGTVPMTLFSSVPLADAHAVINFPGEYFSDITLEQSGVSSVSVVFQRMDANNASLTFTPGSGASVIGTNQFGTLRVAAISPLTNTTIVPLRVTSLNITPVDSAATPTILGSHGQVVIIGTRPLLEAHFNAQGGRELTLFARQGTYFLEYTLDLTSPTWTRRGQVAVTSNLFRLIPTANTPPTNQNGFFRIRQ